MPCEHGLLAAYRAEARDTPSGGSHSAKTRGFAFATESLANGKLFWRRSALCLRASLVFCLPAFWRFAAEHATSRREHATASHSEHRFKVRWVNVRMVSKRARGHLEPRKVRATARRDQECTRRTKDSRIYLCRLPSSRNSSMSSACHRQRASAQIPQP